jgi:(2Fe-2S) ferredoxin
MSTRYRAHLFICTNRREGKPACADHDAEEALQVGKRALAALAKDRKSEFRVNAAGCLGRCEEGPVMVSYPKGEWYRFRDPSDVERIVAAEFNGDDAAAHLKIE